MSIQIAPVVMAAMAGFSTIMAVKAIAEGDYLGALAAGAGAFAGFAGSGLMGGAANAATQAASPAATSGLASAAAPGAAGTLSGNIANLNQMGMAPAQAAGLSSASGALTSASPALAAAATPASVASGITSGGGGFLDSVTSGLKTLGDAGSKIMTEMGEMVNLGDGTFQAADGSIFDQAGKLISAAKPVLGYLAKKQNTDDILDANKDARDQARADVNAERSRRGYVPKNTTQLILPNSTARTNRSVA